MPAPPLRQCAAAALCSCSAQHDNMALRRPGIVLSSLRFGPTSRQRPKGLQLVFGPPTLGEMSQQRRLLYS